jgi:hypothetical protein
VRLSVESTQKTVSKIPEKQLSTTPPDNTLIMSSGCCMLDEITCRADLGRFYLERFALA